MANEGHHKLNNRAVRRIAVATFCTFIAVCVALVMVKLYEPSQNALGALSSVCMDIICMLILVIVLCSFAFVEYKTTQTTALFTVLLVATIWAMFLDFLNWAFDGSLVFSNYTYWFTVGSLCMGSILACIFILYLYSYMKERHKLKQMHIFAKICAILNLVSFVVTVILALTKTAFTFVDGHYTPGELYDVVTAIPVLTLFFMIGVCIRYVKKIGVHDIIAVIGYTLFMITGALLEGELKVGTTYVAVAIADIFIFLMLQNEIIAQEKRNVVKWMERSNTDELTGFYNRHAYEQEMTELESATLAEDFIYVSVDVNALKAVNDTLGHNAGDELLIGAAECLKTAFGQYGKLYRTGGDEFAALLYATDSQLDQIKKDIVEVSENWNGQLASNLTISCGYISYKEAGKMSVRQMAILADKRMYEAKAHYYKTSGQERRNL